MVLHRVALGNEIATKSDRLAQQAAISTTAAIRAGVSLCGGD